MSRTVLIVDDHPSFRATARTLLESEGFEVVGEAADGETGLASARALSPEVVLLDVGLPGMDGFAVASALSRCAGPAPGPAVVLVSSRAAADYGLDAVAGCGARGFVSKADLSGAAVEALL